MSGEPKQTDSATPPRKPIRIESPSPRSAESYLKAEISTGAIRHNLGLLRRCLTPGTELCAVVKADCYGHGRDLLLDLIASGADSLAVATPDEALDLRSKGYTGRILVFFSACAYADGRELREAVAELIARKVTLTVAQPEEIPAVAAAASVVDQPAEVHVKIDSGMTRSGILHDRAGEVITPLLGEKRIRLTGVYTHFATADEPDKTFTLQQLERFQRAVDNAHCRDVTLHAANSAATIDLPTTHLDMVRPGIAIYGYEPSDGLANHLPLQPSLRLTAKLMQVKNVPAGSRAGYGLSYEFEKPARVGLVPVGYGDGYLRCFSNRATMRVRGHDVPVRGRVAMDQTLVDLTAVPDARVGDEVEIISNQPNAPHSVIELAKLAETIPYEITCRLGKRVRRQLIE
ncbi:MAG: alanine racemase [Planctomycetota bacterium]